MSNLAKLLAVHTTLAPVFAGLVKFALGHYPKSAVRELLTATGVPVTRRRAECAQILRHVRRIRRLARGSEKAHRLARQAFNIAKPATVKWWRWADDLAQRRWPLDFTAEAREERAVELLARFLDGSILRCACGECPPLPKTQFMERARELLAVAGE